VSARGAKGEAAADQRRTFDNRMGFELAAEILSLGRRQGEHEWTLNVFVQPMHRPDAMFDARAASEGRQTEPLRELLQVLI
jgi:hypothetical protein